MKKTIFVFGIFVFLALLFYLIIYLSGLQFEFKPGLVQKSRYDEHKDSSVGIEGIYEVLQRKLWKDKYGGKCTCEKYRERRALLQKQRYEFQEGEGLTVCQGNSPWNYISSGLVVEPLKTVPLAGLSLNDIVKYSDLNLLLNFNATQKTGCLYISHLEKFNPNINTKGNNTFNLEISGVDSLQDWNFLFENIYFRSKTYEINGKEVISVEETNLLKTKISFEIKIKTPEIIRADESTQGKAIHELVTVITKTFERYKQLNQLVKSVNKFYPKMTIIVADDSEKKFKIAGKNVKHYSMPFAEGWFAGRNLALSQVQTKYFVWMDDDMGFTAGTKLESLVEIMENARPQPDIVHGYMGKRTPVQAGKVFNPSYTEDGNLCLELRSGSYHAVDGFPQCVWTDAVRNFFMGRTSTVRKVGFDPFYRRVAHPEFFFDGYGQIRVASCQGTEWFHNRGGTQKYYKYRQRKNDPHDLERCTNHTLNTKTNLACFTRWSLDAPI